MLQLYHWSMAECLKEYAHGDIIVMAESIGEALQKAEAYMDIWLKEQRSWWFTDGVVNEWFRDDYLEFKRILEEDLKAEPDVKDPAVIFIRGSE